MQALSTYRSVGDTKSRPQNPSSLFGLSSFSKLTFYSFSCDNCMQRVFRGYRGRMIASQERVEIAEFINKMRTLDAVLDEEEYWNNHPWAKFKKDVKDLTR